jgi:phage tail sheath protein FI
VIVTIASCRSWRRRETIRIMEPRQAVNHPIEGVDTDVAGIVGVTEYGPATPTLIRSWPEFEATFGGFIDRPPFVTPYWRLPYAVRGFFENGGRRLYVARVLDATAPAAADDLAAFVGEGTTGVRPTGMSALMARPDISLMVAPDDTALPGLAGAVIDGCESARDRFAILDAVAGPGGPADVAAPRDTAFGAVYHPRLHVPAPHLVPGYAVVPPCGHVAGVLAKAAVGASRAHAGVALDPASLIPDGHPSGAGALEHRLSSTDVGRLVGKGVNVLRDFRSVGRGVQIWSARTMSSDPEWRYVSVRRLLVFLEQSIARGTRWVVFEPNDEPTWLSVRVAVENFLVQVWRTGALAGHTADKAFFVKCDRTTMTHDDLDNGRLVCMVGVAPVRPAEFVIFRIGQWTAERCAPDCA